MKDKIVNLYGKDFYMKESTKGTCGSDEDGYKACYFYEKDCKDNSQHFKLCCQITEDYYFIEVN